MQKYGFWGAIVGIFLLALFGVRSAATWLTSAESDPEPAISIDGRNADDSFVTGGNGTSSQTNARFGDRSQDIGPGTLTFGPLEEAGTFIQRQKSGEVDALVAQTEVEAVSVASNTTTPTAAQPDTRVTQPAPSTLTTESTQPSGSTSTTQPVQALW